MTLTLELTDDEAERVRAAQQKGIDVTALMRGLVSDLPKIAAPNTSVASHNGNPTASTVSTVAKQTGLAALMDEWEREDATDDEDELNRRDVELSAFKKGINAERERAGARKIYR